MNLEADVLDMQEALRTLEMIGKENDLWMHVESERAGDVKGESDRIFIDQKSRLEPLGYYISGGSLTDSTGSKSKGRRQYSSLRILRATDAATASLMALFGANDDITVELSKFKAGGDVSKDLQPTFAITIKKARVKTYTLLSGGGAHTDVAVEIIEFAFRTIKIESAPQTSTGLRGAVRSFSDTMDSAA